MPPATTTRPTPSPPTLAARRSFNRFELKYLLKREDVPAFAAALEPWVYPDPYAGPEGAYRVASLYYDTDDYRCYWEKIEGIRFRRKLRVRVYESDDPLTAATPVFVEIKQRLNRVTQKRRVVLPYADALALAGDGEIPDHEARDNATIDEIAAMTIGYGLRPAVITAYERTALVGGDEDAGLRITFDADLRYKVGDPALHDPAPGIPMLDPTRVVLEVKVNDRIPYWLTEIVGQHNCRLVRISKYTQALEAAGTMPRSIFFHGTEGSN
jgi:hypothetical protein